MKITIFQIIIFLLIINSCSNKEVTPIEQNISNPKEEKLSISESNFFCNKEFELYYVYAGLGSGMGNKGPMFKIIGNKFLYTRQQNSSSTGEFNNTIDTICQGEIRMTSIDSIKEVTNQIRQSKIFKTNPDVMSGGIYNIIIFFENKRMEFRLTNTSHPKAKEIIEIVNSNIPKKYNKLSLWKDWNEREYISKEYELKLSGEIKRNYLEGKKKATESNASF